MGIKVKGQQKSLSATQAKVLVDSGKARIVSPSVLEMVNSGEETVGFREKRGFRDEFPYPFGPWIQPTHPAYDVIITAATLRRVHRKSAAVRPVVSFVVRALSTTPWSIVGLKGTPKRDLNYAVDLFTSPGMQETFRTILAKILTDLLVLDMVYVEKIRSGSGGIVEFAPRDPATFRVKTGDNGAILSYEQIRNSKDGSPMDPIPFALEDIVRTMLYPRTDSFMGTPVIESIIDEVTALMLASRGIASFFDEDEIPPGILHLGDIGSEAYTRAKADFEAKGGMKSKRVLRTIYGKNDPKWIPFQRPFREMEIANIMPRIERVIWRAFGITPLDVGMSQDVNRSASEGMKEIRTFTLFKPILDLLAEAFTYGILHEINPKLFLEFQHFSRTGEESDQEGGGENVNSDTPGEGSGGGEIRSPLFGGYGLNRKGMTSIICRPPMMVHDYRASRPNWSDEEIISLFAEEGVSATIQRAIETGDEVVQAVLLDMAEEIHCMSRGSAAPAEIQAVAEYCRDQIVSQVENVLRSTEGASYEYVMKNTNLHPSKYSEGVTGLSDSYKRKLNELVVDQITSTTIDASEEAALIGAFDIDKLSVTDMIRKAAAAPIRAAIEYSEN